MLKRSCTIIKWDSSQDARMLQFHKSIHVIHHIKGKTKIVLTDVKKAFDKAQHPFMIKTLSKVGKEGALLTTIKAIYEKPTAYFILNGKKLKAFPLRHSNKTRMSTFTTPIQHGIGSPSHSN